MYFTIIMHLMDYFYEWCLNKWIIMTSTRFLQLEILVPKKKVVVTIEKNKTNFCACHFFYSIKFQLSNLFCQIYLLGIEPEIYTYISSLNNKIWYYIFMERIKTIYKNVSHFLSKHIQKGERVLEFLVIFFPLHRFMTLFHMQKYRKLNSNFLLPLTKNR